MSDELIEPSHDKINIENTRETIEFLEKQIDAQISFFERAISKNRRWAITLRLTSILAGTIVTGLLGIQILFESDSQIKNLLTGIAIFLSALVTISNALGEGFSYRQLWILYTMTLNGLYKLQADLKYLRTKTHNKVVEQDLDKIYQDYSTILYNTNKMWEQIRQKELVSPDPNVAR
jgi:hypothetical protein